MSGTSDTCTACTDVLNAASDAKYSCTSANDSEVSAAGPGSSACATGYEKKTKTAADTGDTCVSYSPPARALSPGARIPSPFSASSVRMRGEEGPKTLSASPFNAGTGGSKRRRDLDG